MQKAIDLSEILRPYSNEWVALSSKEDKVVAHGKTPQQAFEKAKNKGEKDPVLTKAPKEYGSYILCQ